MSVVPMRKATLFGAESARAATLAALQDLGCVHLISAPSAEPPEGPASPLGFEAYRAYRFLATCPHRRRQVSDARSFDREAVEAEALRISERIQDLEDERDFLVKRIEALTPWGDFRFPTHEEIGGLSLWFYVVPRYRVRELEAGDLVWHVVRTDNRFAYVVVVGRDEPAGVPAPRVHTGGVSLGELRSRLEALEIELEDLQARRAALTRWCDLFARALADAENAAALRAADHNVLGEDRFFVVQGWVPVDRVPALRDYVARSGLALVVEEPGPDDRPPTLLRNPPPLDGGTTLVEFYATPGYRAWDPSAAIFASFAVFFAMILGDAGYAAVLGAVLALQWRRLGGGATLRRVRRVATAVVGASLAYGVAAGSYFGVTPPPGSLLGALHVVDALDQALMLRVSLWIGAAHVALANAATAWHLRRSARALAPLGWCAILGGAAGLWIAHERGAGAESLHDGSIAALAGGAASVVLFSTRRRLGWRRARDWLARIGEGLLALTGLTNAFGDVMSYMRLFALGLATTAMAATFNELAAGVRAGLPGVGLLVAMVVLAFGHGLNLALGVMSGVVHGLRLNFLEFFRWGMEEEGEPFRPLAKKERPTWTS